MAPTAAPEPNPLPPALRALADPTRLSIMLMLQNRRRTVGQVVDFFALSQPTISRHLQTLTRAGLVRRQKQGQRVYYEVNPGSLRGVCVGLAESFPCCCVTISPTTDATAGRSKATRPVKNRTPKEKSDG
ncbi:MAG: winged helix-turn-helix transcriptional regulator [candidate division Zixibacteria bacterium]|nr:winged helix-turn-helix transcriptional regulator [candidate division Zixibacteria bacterium]